MDRITERVAEEVADVEIMLAQVKILLDIFADKP